MAERSLIGKLNPDKSITYIYVHFDGTRVGKILKDYYLMEQRVDALLDLGDLLILGIFLSPEEKAEVLELDKIPPHSYKRPAEDVTVSFKRDRKETDTDKKEAKNLIELKETTDDYFAEHIYLFNPATETWRHEAI